MTVYNDNVPSDIAGSEHPDKESDAILEFAGGVDLSRPPHKIAEGRCRGITNMYYPREIGIPHTRPGCGVHEDDTGTATEVTAMHVYRKSTTLSYVCFSVINGAAQELWYKTGTDAPVLLDADLGSLETPSMVTYNGCLLVAVPGEPIKEWQGFVTGTAARGTTTATFSAACPTDGQQLTIGTQTWTWKTTPTTTFQIAVNTTPATAATLLIAAINRDSNIVMAAANADPAKVDITARRIGTAGNLALIESGTGFALSGAAMTLGANGAYLDDITTYMAPEPGFLVIDQNQRLVASGDPAAPDTVYFSAPTDQWNWATGVYGNGETFQLGYLDGMDVTAIHPQLGDLVVHKSGQGRNIFRINTLDADPTTWTSGMKKFGANTSAINHRCSASVTDKHCFLDTRGFSVLTGTDTYDEIVVKGAGGQIADQLAGASRADSFMVVNPDENYIMVFTAAGKTCWVFHYGSARWTKWVFRTPGNITCGCYHDGLGTVLLGTDDAKILYLDPTSSLDDGTAFQSEIVSRALGNGLLQEVLVGQVLIDWKNMLAGAGSVWLAINNEDTPSQKLFDFTVEENTLLLRDTTGVVLEDATMLLIGSSYGRSNTFSIGGGELVSLVIRLTQGAFALNGATVRFAQHGRDDK